MILICPFISSTANFSELVKEFLNSSTYALSPLSAMLCSTNTLWLPYLTMSWQDFCVPQNSSFPSSPSVRCLLPLFSHPISLYIFLLKCSCLLSCCLHAKGQCFKTLQIYKTLKILLCQKMFLAAINWHLI